MKRLLLDLMFLLVFTTFIGCDKQREVDMPNGVTEVKQETCNCQSEGEKVRYYVKYRATCNATTGFPDDYLRLSYMGADARGGVEQTTSKELEVVIGPVPRGFRASASSYHTAMGGQYSPTKIYVTTQIWVSYNEEPFTLKESISHLGSSGQTITYTIQ